MVEIYKGNEIDKSKIATLKKIAYNSYDDRIYVDHFADIYDIKGLAGLHCVSIDTENLVLGTDWFLCYSESNNFIHILEWVCVDNGNIIKQTAEMMGVLKKIFLQNKEKYFIADMRQDTSYAMYLKMLERGYFHEFRREYTIDCSAPLEVYDIKNELIEKYNNEEEFLAYYDSKEYNEYFEYLLYHISFIVTNKFMEKYGKPSTGSQGHVLKKKNNK